MVRSSWLSAEVGCQKPAHGGANLGGMGLQREVPGVEQDNLGLWHGTLVSERTGRQEMWIVAAPDGQQRGRMRPEVSLERRIKSEIAGVIQDQVELDFLGAGPRHVGVVQGVAVRRYQRGIGAMQVLPVADGIGGQRGPAGL